MVNSFFMTVWVLGCFVILRHSNVPFVSCKYTLFYNNNKCFDEKKHLRAKILCVFEVFGCFSS